MYFDSVFFIWKHWSFSVLVSNNSEFTLLLALWLFGNKNFEKAKQTVWTMFAEEKNKKNV